MIAGSGRSSELAFEFHAIPVPGMWLEVTMTLARRAQLFDVVGNRGVGT